jgi:acyl-coenzyme A thioesterase PaaI-like protein
MSEALREAYLGPYRVEAFNASKESENKIHDDDVARRFGFRGGLVPGVDVYAYMTHLPVRRWGLAWIERGTAECRFLKPVYDGDVAVVSASEVSPGLDLQIESHGELCATGRAAMPSERVTPPPVFREAPVPPAERPPADETTLAIGTRLAMNPFRVTDEYAEEYLRTVREAEPLYARESLVHPGTILHVGNWVLRHNVVLGPWMHVGSTVQHFAAAHIGDALSARAVISANYERKGHRFVELDVLVYEADAHPIARIGHIAIYRPRQVAES